MQPHQQRVISERDELSDKVSKLTSFIDPSNKIYASLDKQDQHLLEDQLIHMCDYLEVLEKRILRFK